MYFFILDMLLNLEIENEINLLLDELKIWKLVELNEWLIKRGMKKFGNKDIFINRIYRGMKDCLDFDEFCDNNSEVNCSECFFIYFVIGNWKIIENDNIFDMIIKDVDVYFLYCKNLVIGGLINFERLMKKVKKFSNEGFVKDIEYNEL